VAANIDNQTGRVANERLSAAVMRLLHDEPIGFVDVGARGNIHPLVESIAPAVAVLGFEPDAAEVARLLAAAQAHGHFATVEIEDAALSNKNGIARLHHLSVPTNSSLLPPNPIFVERYAMDKWREISHSDVATTTLDNVLARKPSSIRWGEMIKIDTQGTEFEILEGARQTLRERTSFLCIEVSFCELYRGQKLFSEVEQLLRELGFSFYGFDRVYHRSRKRLDKRTHWTRERMIQADAYFFRDPGDRPSAPCERRHRGIAAIGALVAGYHDLALELAQQLGPEADDFVDAVRRVAALSAADAVAAVEHLERAVRAETERANVLVGKFVDERRGRNDYYDTI